MTKEDIKSKELQRLIALKTDKLSFDEVTDEEIRKIDEITLNGKLINGNPSGIDVSAVELFPELTKLVVANFVLNQDDVDKILSLEKLKILEIRRSGFENVNFNGADNRDISIEFTGCEGIQFKYPKVKNVVVRGTKIDFRSIDFSSAEDVIIQMSDIYNAADLITYPNIKSVNFDGSTLYSNYEDVIEDIAVAPQTEYSHEEETRLYDDENFIR